MFLGWKNVYYVILSEKEKNTKLNGMNSNLEKSRNKDKVKQCVCMCVFEKRIKVIRPKY